MKILSFDQSTIKTGYAIFDDTDLILHGVIDLHKCNDAYEREQMMRIKIKNLIKDCKPAVVVMEGISVRVNPQTAIMLGRLQGHIESLSWDFNADSYIYMPTEWRKIDGIKQGRIPRKELKAQAILFVEDCFGISVTDDEAEAIAIGVAYLKDHGVLPCEKE